MIAAPDRLPPSVEPEGFVGAAMRSRPAEGSRRLIRLCGHLFRLVIVGDRLAERVAPAFVHLTALAKADHRDPAPCLGFIDLDRVGMSFPQSDARVEAETRGEGWRVIVHGQTRYLDEERADSLLRLDRRTGSALAAYRSADTLALMDKARPLMRLMPMLCRSLGALDIHASAVAEDGAAVVIVGASGRGKTTTAIDGLDGGLDFLGDDSVAIRDDGDGFTVHSLYGSARVASAGLARWPRFAPLWELPGPDEDKALLLMARAGVGRAVSQARLVGTVVLERTGGPVTASRVSGREALTALLRESRDVRRFHLAADEFHLITKMASAVPCHRLTVGTDPAAVADGLLRLIRSAR